MSKNKIVAVVGMCGSGKTVAVNEFEKRGWTKIYFGEATFIKMKELGLEINEENERIKFHACQNGWPRQTGDAKRGRYIT